MSSFRCEKCGTDIIDTQYGYVTECQHWHIEDRTDRPCPKCGCQIFDPFGGGVLMHDVNRCRGHLESKYNNPRNIEITMKPQFWKLLVQIIGALVIWMLIFIAVYGTW